MAQNRQIRRAALLVGLLLMLGAQVQAKQVSHGFVDADTLAPFAEASPLLLLASEDRAVQRHLNLSLAQIDQLGRWCNQTAIDGCEKKPGDPFAGVHAKVRKLLGKQSFVRLRQIHWQTLSTKTELFDALKKDEALRQHLLTKQELQTFQQDYKTTLGEYSRLINHPGRTLAEVAKLRQDLKAALEKVLDNHLHPKRMAKFRIIQGERFSFK